MCLRYRILIMNEIINHEFMCRVIATEDAAHIWDIFCVHVVLLMCVCVCVTATSW